MICNICPHNCQVERGLGLGVCHAPDGFKIAHIQLHHWEEPCLSGTKGSGTIFFSHCNLKCVFCQNSAISQEGEGQIIDQEKFIKLCIKLKNQGAHNLNFVSPTCYTDLLVKILPLIKEKIKLPIVWNSNAYEKVETLKKLKVLVDIYLPDFKYFSDELAFKYSGAKNYQQVALNAIKEMLNQVGPVQLDKEGLITKGVIIRHLILPGQVSDTLRVLKLLKQTFNESVWVSVMAQYYPTYQVGAGSGLNRLISDDEYQKVLAYYNKLNFGGGYYQLPSSASSSYTPDFTEKSLDLN